MNRDEMYQLYLEALEEMKAEASKHDFSPAGEDRLSSAMAKFKLYRESLINFDNQIGKIQAANVAHIFAALGDIHVGPPQYPVKARYRRQRRIRD